MNKEELIAKLEKIETLIDTYNDVIATESEIARGDISISSPKNLEETFKRIEDKNRLLNIGIIGKVKAGKSSMLNSVFFDGKSVLPKAATPMTASLTAMTYGNSFSIKLEYYTGEDIDDIKRKHDEYEKKVEKKINAIYEQLKKEQDNVSDLQLRERASQMAKIEMNGEKELERIRASFEQYELMKNSGLLDEMKSKSKPEETIEFNSIDELKDELQKYVGHDGKMMPFTRNVVISMPNDSLSDIRVIDTPGFNDPVESRTRRTKEYLGECDVIFIVSSAGQFLTSEDEELMDRISSKEGVRQLYCVASQADNQIHGNDIAKAARGDLDKAIDLVSSKLSGQIVKVLSQLKKKPEVRDMFDQLINESKERLIIISAICHALNHNLENRSVWDKEMNTVWGNLQGEYKDYFDGSSASESLKSLSGIEEISKKISLVRSEKDGIILEKQKEHLLGQEKKIKAFIERLKVYADENIKTTKEVKEADMANIEQEIKKHEQDKELFEEADEIFEKSLERFLKTCEDKIINEAFKLGVEVMNKMNAITGEKTIITIKEKKGFFAAIARTIWGGGKEEIRTQVKTIRVGAVENILKDFKIQLKNLPTKIGFEELKQEWRNSVAEQIHECIKKINTTQISIRMFNKAFLNMIQKTVLPNIDLSRFQQFSYQTEGILEGESNIAYLFDAVKRWLLECQDFYDGTIKELTDDIKEVVKKEKYIWPIIDKQVEDLKKHVENKELTVKRLEEFKTALGGI